MQDFDEGTEELVGQYSRELYDTGRFKRVNVKAVGIDGFDYQAVVQDDVGRLITNPADYRIGDIVLFQGHGPTFTILSFLLGLFDKDWRKLKRKPWHVGFLTMRQETHNNRWLVGEANGRRGVQHCPLDLFKETYQVFRWFDTPPDEAAVAAFMAKHKGEKYDNFWGYLNTILWFFVSWWPRIIDHRWECWEYLYLFAVMFGKPIDEEYAYPLITILMDKLGYPRYE